MGRAARMAVVARDQAVARQSHIIASEQGFRSHRSKLALGVGLVVTNTSSTAIITFAFAVVVASCKLVVARVTSTASAIVSTFAAVGIVIITACLRVGHMILVHRHPYLPFQLSF